VFERGDHIVPNFEEIWPSGKSKAGKEQCNPSKGINYVMNAMAEGVPGVKNEVFTTVGKPKVTFHGLNFLLRTYYVLPSESVQNLLRPYCKHFIAYGERANTVPGRRR
jgi:hypothetical protein